MPRGSKTCAACGQANGPRSWNCSACGKGFIVKGLQKPDMDVTAHPPRSDPDAAKQRLWNLVEVYDDALKRKKHKIEGRTWQSKCGQYRIQERLTFMGVRIADHYSKCVHLLRKVGGEWTLVRPKGKFKTPLAAIKRMVKDSNGQKVKATTKQEKLAVRVAALNRQESQYDL